MLKKWLAMAGVIAVLAGAGLIGYRIGLRGVAKNGLPSSDQETPLSLVAPDLSDNQSLNDKVDQLARQVAALSGAVVHVPETASPMSGTAAVSRPITRKDVAESQVDWRVHMAEVQESFVSQPRKPEWADSTRTALGDALRSDVVLGPLVGDIDCRSTTCRVEFINNTEPDFSGKVSEFFNQVGHLLPSMEADFATNPDGTKAARIYLSNDTTTSDG